MSSTTIQFYDQKLQLQRLLFSYKTDKSAPTVIFFGGIHGNEPAGIYGLNNVIEKLKDNKLSLKGNFYAIAGNLNALKKNIRFEEADLNRLWTQENMGQLLITEDRHSEQVEQLELYELIKDIVSENNGPFYFIDLHTTSAETIPFITISDSLNNRKFAANFAIPVILGIEEHLDGPLLTFINEFGHVSLGFEAGQHEDIRSVANCEAFIWQVLIASNCINKSELKISKALNHFNFKRNFYEIDDHYFLRDGEDFIMLSDFKNFDAIQKHQVLAVSDRQEIKAKMSGRILMPLYQKQGKEGFFIVRKISKFWLWLSSVARLLKLHHILRILPGIRQDTEHKYTLIVNPKTARFLATEVFHLFGYRKKIAKNGKLHFIKRDRAIIPFHK